MKKRVLSISLILILITSIFLSSFASAENVILDNLEVNGVPAPEIPTDGLLKDELSTEINEEYYNSEHFVDGEEEVTEFDNKQDFIQSEQLPNQSKQTVQDEQNAAVYNDYSMRSVAASSNDDNGIALYSADDGHYIFPDGWNGNILGTGTEGGWGPWRNCYAEISSDDAYTYACAWILNYVCPLYAIPSDMICKENFILYHDTTEMSDSSTIGDKIQSRYVFYFIGDDSLNFSSGYSGDGFISYAKSDKDTFLNDNYVSGYLCFDYQKDIDGYALTFNLGYVELDGIYKKINGSDPYKNTSLVYSSKDVFVDNTKLDRVDDSGLILSNIVGSIKYQSKSQNLSFEAHFKDEADSNKYPVSIFGFDAPSAPAKFSSDLSTLSYSAINMDNYLDLKLELSSSTPKVSGSLNLEKAYYYLHQMKAYDDSLESVAGYDSDDEFEARQNVLYVLAYKKGDNWITLAYYLFDYTDIIENVMGAFTVKKDYLDFPDMDNYLDDFESWDDIARELADGEGVYNKVECGLKWIGRNLVHFAHNFIGFFRWLFACIPVLWKNLVIALYNLVCDLKSLALYLFNPKTKSIYQMATERIPSFNLLVNAFSNNSASELPSFTLFGTKFSLDLADYDIDFSFIRSISTIIFYVLFGYFIFKLVFKIFGFGGSGDTGGDDE